MPKPKQKIWLLSDSSVMRWNLLLFSYAEEMQMKIWLAISKACLRYALLLAHYLKGQSLNILSAEQRHRFYLFAMHTANRKLYYNTEVLLLRELWIKAVDHHPKMTVKERWNINLSLSLPLCSYIPAISFLLLYPPPSLFRLCCCISSISFLHSAVLFSGFTSVFFAHSHNSFFHCVCMCGCVFIKKKLFCFANL